MSFLKMRMYFPTDSCSCFAKGCNTKQIYVLWNYKTYCNKTTLGNLTLYFLGAMAQYLLIQVCGNILEHNYSE